MYLVAIIFFGLLLLTYLAYKNKIDTFKKISEFCVDDSMCKAGYVCKKNPEFSGDRKQCLPSDKDFCHVAPATDLTSCNIDLNDCDKCLNNPKFTCVEVTDEKPYKWKIRENCKIGDPCSYNGVCIGTTGSVTYCEISAPKTEPGKGWCLPNVKVTDTVCNPYTSDYILYQVDAETSTYAWGCRCKYPNLFDHASGSTSDCSMVRACGADNGNGTLFVPKKDPISKNTISCSSNSQCGTGGVCKPSHTPAPCGALGYVETPVDCSRAGSNCICHVEWNGEKDINPLSGHCECGTDNLYQCVDIGGGNYQMNCLVDKKTCHPYKEENDYTKCNIAKCYTGNDGRCKCCDCGPGSIRCPDDIPTGNPGLINFCQTNGSMCVNDPCVTADVPDGQWDPHNRVCICNKTHPNGRSVPNEASLVGQVCVDLCKGNGPCGSRGNCFVQSDIKFKQAQCCGCQKDYTNTTDTNCVCSDIVPYMEKNNEWFDSGARKRKKTVPCDPVGSPKDYKILAYNANRGEWEEDGPCKRYIGDTCPTVADPTTDVCVITSSPQPVSCGNREWCPPETRCCGSTGHRTCCPYKNGVCCDDGIHCCPGDKPICNLLAQTCSDAQGNSIPFDNTTPISE